MIDQNVRRVVYAPPADVVARAFDLGPAVGELIHVRSGDTHTWRLETAMGGVAFIKGYRSTTSGQFVPGGLQDQLEVAMAFERRALEAGLDMPVPIPPTDPLVGWVTCINEQLFRAYRWVEHRAVGADDDIAGWLGSTMARIHQMEPVDSGWPTGVVAWGRPAACGLGGLLRRGSAP